MAKDHEVFAEFLTRLILGDLQEIMNTIIGRVPNEIINIGRVARDHEHYYWPSS